MLKKIFCAAFLMAAVFFIGNTQVYAKDVWLYTDGKMTEYYVMEETIVNKSTRHNRNFDVNIKSVRRSGNKVFKVEIEKWSFSENDGMLFYSVGTGNKVYSVYENPFAQKVRSYCLKYLGL